MNCTGIFYNHLYYRHLLSYTYWKYVKPVKIKIEYKTMGKNCEIIEYTEQAKQELYSVEKLR